MVQFFPKSHVVTALLFCRYAFSAPIPLFGVVYRPSSPPYDGGDHRILNTAIEGAARQIGFMRNTIESAQRQEAGSLQKIKDVFGEQFNLDEIDQTIKALDSGILRISSWQAHFADPGTLAIGSKSKHTVRIGTEFYNAVATPDWLRIGTLIHEATHVLQETVDDWEWLDDAKSSLVPASVGHGITDGLKGQWDNDYDLVKQHASSSFHKNADTWVVFGYYLERGSFPPHNPPINPSTRRLQFVDLDQLKSVDPDLLVFGPAQWFTVIPNLS
jgi:hypothetical protein